MKKVFCVMFALAVLAVFAGAQEPKTHIALTPADVKWGPAPPTLQKGAELAVISGNPAAAGPFVIRLKMPAGYRIAPHWHPTDEHVTVISGTFALGMGDKVDAKAMKEMGAGSYGMLPAEMRHYAMAKTAAIVQVHGTGPFVLNYVNTADDPSKATSMK